MRTRVINGDVGLALVFAALGIVWIVGALGLPFWQGFAPESGFLPLFYGILLVGLAAAVLMMRVRDPEAASTDQPVGKPLMVLAALTVSVVGVEPAGFGPSVFLLLAFLFVAVERLPVLRSLVVAGATTAALILIFKTWLGVPLPAGPLGV
jgi:putative tricarboxylic transport membrane protein